MDADAVEIRVLGCLIEKQRTTPDTYPLTLNALRLACNQATNRDPVVDYDEETIREALQRLWRKEWARLASGQGSRAVKYRQLVQDTLGLADDEISVLCVLMLRGPQTPGELKQRTDRLHPFAEPRRGRGDARRAWSSASSRCGSTGGPGRRRSATRSSSAARSTTPATSTCPGPCSRAIRSRSVWRRSRQRWPRSRPSSAC